MTGKMTLPDIRKKLQELGSSEKAEILQRFFKTGPGEYGEGDIFLGVRVPAIRKLAKELRDAPVPMSRKLLASPVHEERLLALIMLVNSFARGNEPARKAIYNLYLGQTRFINNWDLVDVSAEHIVGAYLLDRKREPLYRLADSDLLWERRISIMSTFHYIKQHDFSDTLKISKILLADRHDLIHKAVGWMLREIGKRHLPAEEAFLEKNYWKMPRTMLRYAIERFPEQKRQAYLQGTI